MAFREKTGTPRLSSDNFFRVGFRVLGFGSRV